jgi:lysophospholipase L1-like esterase
MRFFVDSFVGANAGLAEIEVFGQCAGTPSVKIVAPHELDLTPSPSLSVSARTCLDNSLHSGWGVRFVLDGGVAIDDHVAPFQATFTNVGASEHVIDAFVIDSSGNIAPGSGTHDQITQVGVGNYYVAIGDSITRGFGDNIAADDTSQDERNTGGGYEPILNDRLTAARNGRPQTVENEGIGGTTSAQGLARIPTVLARHPSAQRFLVLYGTNDANPASPVPSGLGLSPGHSGYPGTYKDNMQQIITALRSAGKTVVLGKVPFANDSRDALVQQYNMVIDELVANPANGITVPPPDFHAYFAAHYQNEYSDTLHPNGTGYQSMARLWETALSSLP